jgi:hypothetical protein
MLAQTLALSRSTVVSNSAKRVKEELAGPTVHLMLNEQVLAISAAGCCRHEMMMAQGLLKRWMI